MGAFNWVIVNGKCPNCGFQGNIRCQTHIASDYDGDEEGRFHDREYKLGEKMRWWDPSHKKFKEWRVRSKKVDDELDKDCISECCYASCPNCKKDLYVILEFCGLAPVRVLEIGKEEDWPVDYYK